MALSLRIIKDGRRNAAFNMSADRYLLARAADRDNACLRLYSWDPPAVSLGRMQHPDAIVDMMALEKNGVGCVVRPTGGRAVLHWNDLTYSFAFPAGSETLGSTIGESYTVISRCLIRGLELASIPCSSHDSASEYAATKRAQKLPCFLSPNRSEIMAAGKKLVGSAQKRTAGAVLQHGSIPLDGSFRRLPEFLLLPQEERTRQRALLEGRCSCVNEINPAVDGEMLSACCVEGFSEILNVPVFEKPWDGDEIEAVENASALLNG
jgi:lipoate-protein ligase A